MSIHPTAIVHPNAKIGNHVSIGPYVVIDEHVTIGENTKVMHGAHLTGRTTIGRDNEIHFGAVIGHAPQDRSYQGEESYTVVGDRNQIREYVTIHRGTSRGSSTRVGNDTLLMGAVHIGHNCEVQDHVTIANGTALGGHVVVEEGAFLSGSIAVHQFVRIGRLSMVGGAQMIVKDLLPYMVVGSGAKTMESVNIVGLKRAGFSNETIREIKQAFRHLFRSNLNTTQALEQIEKMTQSAEIKHLIAFVRQSKRGILSSKRKRLTSLQKEGIV